MNTGTHTRLSTEPGINGVSALGVREQLLLDAIEQMMTRGPQGEQRDPPPGNKPHRSRSSAIGVAVLVIALAISQGVAHWRTPSAPAAPLAEAERKELAEFRAAKAATKNDEAARRHKEVTDLLRSQGADLEQLKPEVRRLSSAVHNLYDMSRSGQPSQLEPRKPDTVTNSSRWVPSP